MKQYDRIVIGAGIYGLYAAKVLASKGYKTLVLESEDDGLQRGSYINQARLHNGYHYPRSISTALKSKKYFDRFFSDYKDAIYTDFKQIYATSKDFSWTNGEQFAKFCDDAKIYCREIDKRQYFKDGVVDGVFETEEYSFDAAILKKQLIKDAKATKLVDIKFNSPVTNIKKLSKYYDVYVNDEVYRTPYLLNASYASTNQILNMLNLPFVNIKYELCEVILVEVSDELKNVGLTVMDGPFFSIMPFGKTGLHSLTAVTFTPHETSYDKLPTFKCQNEKNGCSPTCLKNCNTCPNKPNTAYEKMYHIAKKYLNDDLKIKYVSSLYTIKPILQTSEIDDSRPTIIREYTKNPTFVTVFSGKMNTMYDLDNVL